MYLLQLGQLRVYIRLMFFIYVRNGEEENGGCHENARKGKVVDQLRSKVKHQNHLHRRRVVGAVQRVDVVAEECFQCTHHPVIHNDNLVKFG